MHDSYRVFSARLAAKTKPTNIYFFSALEFIFITPIIVLCHKYAQRDECNAFVEIKA